jgi:DoxX-like protein
MQSGIEAGPVSKKMLWAGRIMSAVAVLFLLFDSVIKLMAIAPVVDSFTQLGYPVRLAPAIGIVELVCIVAYVIPRTSILGAILLSGYLGGAVATHVRVGSPLLSHVLFPLYVAALLWGGLYVRDDRLRALVPLRS